MPNDVINTITLGNITYDIGGSGHTIEKSDGTDMTQRANLQFVDATVTDDSTNNRTKIENVKTITNESELDDLPDGIYIGPTDEGLPFDAGDIPYDNTESGLLADSVQGAIDELANDTGSGHIIEKSDGTDMTNRANLQFTDSQITDDSTNNRTKVENVKIISSESELANLPDGMYLGNYDEVDEITADDISYDNTTSGLASTNVNDAIDEVVSDLDDNISAKINGSLVTTTTVGGVAQGTTYLIDTPLETIIDDILAPDNRSNLCIQTGYEWSSSTDTLVSYYYYANCMIATTIYDGHPASLRTVDNVTYYPLKIKNNIDNVIITPANDSYIIVNVGIADENGYKRVTEYGTDTDWKTTATNVNVSALRATYGVDDFYIIAKVAKSDWSTVSDIEPLRPTITYVSAISPNIPPVPTSQGLYDLECNINESGNSQLLWKQSVSDIKNELSTESLEVEGNPLSFTTLSAQIAESTIIDLDPIQDLHGYDKPWVGGAGKNLLPMTVEEIKSVNTDGSWNGNVYTINSGKFTILTDNDDNVIGIKVSDTFSATSIFRVGDAPNNSNVGYALNGTPTDLRTQITDGTNPSLNINNYSGDSNYTGGRWTLTPYVLLVMSQNTSGNNKVFYPMIRLATETDPTFAPYTNICPISGRTEIGILGCGKNLFNPTNILNQRFISSQNIIDENVNCVSVYAKCEPNTTYIVSKLNGQRFKVAYAKNIPELNTTVYGTIENATATSITITTGSDAKYIVAWVFNSSVDSQTQEQMLASVQIELGEIASTYEPYTKSNNLTISLGQTVYGGTLDVENGVLVVDRAIVTYPQCHSVLNTLENRTLVQFSTISTSMSDYSDDYICDMFETGNTAANTSVIGSYFYNNRLRIRFPENYGSTQESISAMLSDNPVSFAYPLATPITINLTPHQISLLEGVNNISTTGDKITLTYRDGKVATLKDIKDSLESSKPVYSVYSTVETVVGTYLNKPLYSKTYQVEFSSSNSYYFDVPSTMDIKFVLGGVYSTRFDFIPFGYGGSGDMVQCYRFSDTQFRIQNSYYTSRMYCDVTLQYTKSTD